MNANPSVTRLLVVVGCILIISLDVAGPVGGAERAAAETVNPFKTVAEERKPENEARQSLAGLSGIYVEVSGVKPEVEQRGLTAEILQADVETQLRKAGIQVVSRTDALGTAGSPHLTLAVTTHTDEADLFFVFGIELALVQDVDLVRDATIVGRAATWRTGAVGLVGVQNVQDIRPIIWKRVGQFVNDYLAANPKR